MRIRTIFASLHPGQLTMLVLGGAERQSLAAVTQGYIEADSLRTRGRVVVDSLEANIAEYRLWQAMFPTIEQRREAILQAFNMGIAPPNANTLGMRQRESAVRAFYDQAAQEATAHSRDAGLAAQAVRRYRTRVDAAMAVLVVLTGALLWLWFGARSNAIRNEAPGAGRPH